MRTTAESTRGGGSKASGGTSSSVLDLVAPLQHHAQPAVVLAAGRRRHAVDDFLLQHEVLVGDVVDRLRAGGTGSAWRCCRAGCRRRAAARPRGRGQRGEVDLAARRLRSTSRPGVRRSRAARSRSSSITVERARSARSSGIGQRAAPRADLDQRLARPRRRSRRRSRRSPPGRRGNAGRSASSRRRAPRAAVARRYCGGSRISM